MPRNPNKIDYSKGFPAGFETFNSLTDPRSTGNTKHHFGEVIFIAFTSILCGITSYDLFEEFALANEKWFQKWLKLPHGIPSYITFARVLEALDPELFAQCIVHHLQSVGVVHSEEQIAIDGKALRGSRTKEERHIHAVSAWACEAGVTLAQSFVDKKSNEITAIPELLKLLNLEDAVITIDAMGTQRAIAQQIIENKGDYILSVKENQKSLHDELSDHFHFASTQLDTNQLHSDRWSHHVKEEQNRGRTERRVTLVCTSLDWMNKEIKKDWIGLKSIILVQRQVKVEGKDWRLETHFYISSLEHEGAESMQQYIRSHWRIENSCHWVIDTLFREDHNQTGKRNAAKNLSILRRIALNTLTKAPDKSRRKKQSSLPMKQLWAAQSEQYREAALSLVS